MRVRQLTLTDPERGRLLDALAAQIGDALIDRNHHRRVVGFRMGRRLGSYMTALYIFIKALYLLNVAAQFLALNAFIGRSYTYWGVEVLRALLTGENWQVRLSWE